MGRKVLTKEQEDHVVTWYTAKTPVKKIAMYLHVSTRTIGRVLVRRGVATAIPRLQDEAREVMKLLRKHDINPKELGHILKDYKAGQATFNFNDQAEIDRQLAARVVLDKAQVIQYLKNSTHGEAMEIMYVVGLAKIAQAAAQKQTAQPQPPQQQEQQKEIPRYDNYARTFPSYSPRVR